MQTYLDVAIIQQNLVWENAKENRLKLDLIFSEMNSVDLIVLPEMFTTGFSMNPESVSETMTGDSVYWMKEKSKAFNSAITGSIIIKENNKYYNRMLFVHPNGQVDYYDKKHAFTLAGEDKQYTSGEKRVTMDYKGWKICPLICYDLRFPVWSRNVDDYDILIYVANWPTPRINAWNILLKARAVENMSYCIGANRVGTDVNGHEYSGNSIVIDYLGNQQTRVVENKETIIYTTLHKDKMLKIREVLPFLKDKDQFKIQ